MNQTKDRLQAINRPLQFRCIEIVIGFKRFENMKIIRINRGHHHGGGRNPEIGPARPAHTNPDSADPVFKRQAGTQEGQDAAKVGGQCLGDI